MKNNQKVILKRSKAMKYTAVPKVPVDWWQQMCIAIAQTFYMGLVNSSEKMKTKAKAAALIIYNSIKMAYADDPDFQ